METCSDICHSSDRRSTRCSNWSCNSVSQSKKSRSPSLFLLRRRCTYPRKECFDNNMDECSESLCGKGTKNPLDFHFRAVDLDGCHTSAAFAMMLRLGKDASTDNLGWNER